MEVGTGISYVLPLRWSEDSGLAELKEYLGRLASWVDEIVLVDGSPEPQFTRHGRALAGTCRQIEPDPSLDYKMGKVNGVVTGVMAARHERVVVADDDVRYEHEPLSRIVGLLDRAHLVRPQNYFDPLPWHARLDTGRTLINRVWTGDPEFPRGDFPGTLALRRSAFVATGGYDGDVMFENLELMRTVSAAGGIVVSPLDLYVRRLPPSSSHFISQRVRQAYDDFGLPRRIAAFLAVAPLIALAAWRRRPGPIVGGSALVAALAEVGRRRAGGRERYRLSSSLLAPVWVLERAVSVWLAAVRRLRHGGIRYAGRTIERGANSPSELRRRLVEVDLPAPGLEPDRLVGAVAEREHPRPAAAAEGDRPAA